MKKINFFRILIISPLPGLFLQCNKSEITLKRTIVDIVAYNSYDKRAKEGVTFYVLKGDGPNNYTNSYTVVDSAKTDKWGRAKIRFFSSVKKESKYFLYTKPSLNQPQTGNNCYNISHLLIINKGVHNVYLIPVRELVYYKLKLKNTSPFNNNDLITIDLFTGQYPQSNFFVFGSNVDTLMEGPAFSSLLGRNTVPLSYWVTKNNVTQFYSDSIYMNACPESTTISINY
jgi:hypothetical protein